MFPLERGLFGLVLRIFGVRNVVGVLFWFFRHFLSLRMNSSASSAGSAIIVCYSICGVDLFMYYINHKQ